MTQHNHITRDIKPKGECPSCDEYHRNKLLRNLMKLSINHANDCPWIYGRDCYCNLKEILAELKDAVK